MAGIKDVGYTVLYRSNSFHRDCSFAAVIPCIREEKTIGRVIHKLRSVFKPCVFITVVVSDKDDPTAQVAIENNVDAVIVAKEKGYGYAINAGLNFLSKLFDDDTYVIMIDGDDTYNISSIDLSSLELDGKTIVIGVRKLRKNSMKLINKIGNAILNFIFRLFFYKKVGDSQSGFKIFPLFLSKDLKEPGMTFSTEVIIKAIERHMKIKEVPIEYTPRVKGSLSKLDPIRDGARIFKYFLIEGLKKRLGVGIASFLISELLLFINFFILGLSIFWSIVLAGECSIIFGYLMELLFFGLYKESSRRTFSSCLTSFLRYNTIFFPALTISVNFVVVLFYFLNLNPLLTNFLISFLLFPLNYELYTYFNRGTEYGH